MESGDFQLTSQVRNTLIRNWVVPRRLSVSVLDGVVRISGPLSKIPATYLQNDCEELLRNLEKQIREISGVRRLDFSLPEIGDTAPAKELDQSKLAELGLQERMIALEEARIAGHPNYPDLRNRLGLFLAFDGKHEEAIESFDKALDVNPNYFEAIINHAFSVSMHGKYVQAAETIDRQIGTDRPGVYFWLAAARLCAANRDPDRAHECLAEARRTEGDPYLVHHALGLTAILAGESELLDNAEKHLSDALGSETLSRYYSDSGVLDGKVLSQDGAVLLKAAFEKNPNFVAVHVERALHLGHDGDFDAARDELNKAFEIAPGSPQAETAYARLAAVRSETNHAVSHLRQALVQDPGFTAAHLELAFQYGAAGNLVEARAELESARGLQPRYPDVRYHLGILLADTGDTQKAFQEIGQVFRYVKRGPVFDAAVKFIKRFEDKEPPKKL